VGNLVDYHLRRFLIALPVSAEGINKLPEAYLLVVKAELLYSHKAVCRICYSVCHNAEGVVFGTAPGYVLAAFHAAVHHDGGADRREVFRVGKLEELKNLLLKIYIKLYLTLIFCLKLLKALVFIELFTGQPALGTCYGILIAVYAQI
jgi:hypothetical protein